MSAPESQKKLSKKVRQEKPSHCPDWKSVIAKISGPMEPKSYHETLAAIKENTDLAAERIQEFL